MLCVAVIAAGLYLERLVFAAALVPQYLAVVPDRPYAHASVMVNMPGLAAATRELQVVVRQAVIITFDMMIAICHAPTGGLLFREVRSGCNHRPASSGVRRVI
jgi:hypothetical protein